MRERRLIVKPHVMRSLVGCWQGHKRLFSIQWNRRSSSFFRIMKAASPFWPFFWKMYFFMITVSGGWSSWSEWSDCSSNCGQGFQRRDRKCDNPIPRWGGPICEGSHVDRTKCTAPCPGMTVLRLLLWCLRFSAYTYRDFNLPTTNSNFGMIDSFCKYMPKLLTFENI